MLDQNTDRMWYVIGAVLVGGLIIASSVILFSDTVFAGIGDTFNSFLHTSTNEIPDHYVLATDDDFEWYTKHSTKGFQYELPNESGEGFYRYVGSDDYVIIPDKINGNEITTYYRMFANMKIKGVASTNPNVDVMRSMLHTLDTDELDVSHLNMSGLTNSDYMFTRAKVDVLDLRGLDTSGLKSHDSMFYGSDTDFIYVSNSSDAKFIEDELPSSASTEVVIK